MDARVFLVVSLVAVAAACCGRGSRALRISPNRADAVANEALPSENDLSGLGWQVLTGVGTAPPDDGLSGERCRALVAESHAADARLEAGRLGGAERAFGRPLRDSVEPLPPVMLVSVKVEVYDDVNEIDARLAAAARTGSSDDTGQCLADAFVALERRQRLTAAARAVLPLDSAPDGGIRSAWELTVWSLDSGASAVYRLEAYRWRYANALVSVDLRGPRDAFKAQLVEDVVDGTEKRLRAMLK